MNEEKASEIFKEYINDSNKVAFTFEVDTRTIDFLSNGFEHVWKLPKERLLNNPASILDTIHSEDKDYLVKEYSDVLAGKEGDNIEFRIVQEDGSVKWLLSHVRLFIDKQGKRSLTGVVDDITTLKDNISILQKFAAKKNAILEVLSHDLAGPLANIKNLSGQLTKHLHDYKSEDIANILQIIYESSARSVRLIRDFVDQEFMESTNPGLIKIRMNLVEKLKEIVEEYMEAERIIGKTFKFLTSSDHIYVYIDQGKFMQVVNNLISNAIKFTPDGGTITIKLTEHKDSVTLVIKDNGIGIPVEHHDALFDKFTKARREGLKGEPTIGLGMSIIKTIVEWHGGEISFESKVNQGTTFYIELPKK
ncbi:PAS domain-containing sensor histidine kinase [Pontibacter sp. MBLB2868]|uniref:PAS domain-containing sensor histidine kinase n=1 Tax=Pontibacter sp. MBLB2868 TaxID=3451555 RepID=UPI003F755017